MVRMGRVKNKLWEVSCDAVRFPFPVKVWKFILSVMRAVKTIKQFKTELEKTHSGGWAGEGSGVEKHGEWLTTKQLWQ